MPRSGRFKAEAVLPALVWLFIAASACPVHAAPARTVTNSVPAPVRGAFADAYPDAEIQAMSSLSEDGRVSYEIKGLDRGLTLAATYLPDGTLVVLEEEIDAKALPEVVAATVEARHPGSKVVKAVRNTRDGAVTYLLRVAAGGRRLTLVLDEGGGLISARDTGGGKRK